MVTQCCGELQSFDLFRDDLKAMYTNRMWHVIILLLSFRCPIIEKPWKEI